VHLARFVRTKLGVQHLVTALLLGLEMLVAEFVSC